ncbi:hypothetical protein [Hyalangium versicolor]|uniref:hypothetical protein n=1 Tax=Hyalangium versicolor TaxID=2861190 RepID=UPI001CCFF354|nr:hypothetical protein [Hyalangium versicolor]
MKRAACVVLPLLFSACGPEALPTPSIVSVLPERIGAGEPASLSVRVDAALPLVVNYDDESVDPAQLAMGLRIGGVKVDIPFAEPDGTLIVPVPQELALGDYDIQVTLADGREAVREHAFSVVPDPFLSGEPCDGGSPRCNEPEDPDPSSPETGRKITGFKLDHVQDQVRNQPFPITIRALGPGAKSFGGRVSVRANWGLMRFISPDAFSNGVLVQEISISHTDSRVYLLVEDSRGHKGLSNPFRVRSR